VNDWDPDTQLDRKIGILGPLGLNGWDSVRSVELNDLDSRRSQFARR
jgi:hypothetical protein